MAVKISKVVILPQEVTVGETITITVTAVDVTWETMKSSFENWNEIKTDLTNWKSVVNYH